MPNGEPIFDAVERAISGGVNCVQLRDRTAFEDEILECAVRLKNRVNDQALVIVNDQPDIAKRAKLDGLHLPEAAFEPEDDSFRNSVLIGRSIHSTQGALKAQVEGVDYIIAGNIYDTQSHPGKDGEGLDFLSQICKAVEIPVIAVGGISPDKVVGCIDTGASGVAVKSGILNEKDIAGVSKLYHDRLIDAYSKREAEL